MLLRVGREIIYLDMGAAFTPKLWYPSTKLHRIYIPENHYLYLTVCEYYLVERCCELGNEPDVMGAEFIYQLSD